MTTNTLTLTDFLLARIAEDEANARDAEEFLGEGGILSVAGTTLMPRRMLADVEAKRRIVAACRPLAGADVFPCTPLARRTLEALASVYADHEDFQEAWRD